MPEDSAFSTDVSQRDMLDDASWLAARSYLGLWDSSLRPRELATRLQDARVEAGAGSPDRPAGERRYRGIVVAPTNVEAVADAGARVVSVAGFPSGRHHRLVKAAEGRLAVQCGAEEVWIAPDPAQSQVPAAGWSDDMNGQEADQRAYNDCLIDFAAFREAVPAPAQLGLVAEDFCPAAVRAARAAGFDRLVLRGGSVAEVAGDIAKLGGGLDVVYWGAAGDSLDAKLAALEAGAQGLVLTSDDLEPLR